MTHRLGIIGAGAITGFHVPAAHRAGFEVTGVAARPGSASPAKLAESHPIGRTYASAEDLLADAGAWDALLVTVSVPDLLVTLDRALEAGVPVLVEKPVAMRSADLAPYVDRTLPVQVAYNRRFYPGVAALRQEVQAGPPVLATLTLPENVRGWDGGGDTEPLYRHFSNSVHAFDLLAFVFGPLEVESSSRVPGPDGTVAGVAATLVSARGDVVHAMLDWAAPTNMAVSVDRPGRRLELRPFEHLTIYDGMEIVNPTPDRPIRAYQPRIAGEVPLAGDDLELKPGFVAQLRSFAALCAGQDPAPAARLDDARRALLLAEALVGAEWLPPLPPATEDQ